MTVAPTKSFGTKTAKWTLEEYHRMIESGVLEDKRVELIRGEIVEMAPEGKCSLSSENPMQDSIRLE